MHRLRLGAIFESTISKGENLNVHELYLFENMCMKALSLFTAKGQCKSENLVQSNFPPPL